VRATLLVLLWFWAATMFLVVDLFLNVPAFDRARPRAPLYRAARIVAHEMVGEPIVEEGLGVCSAMPVREARGERVAPPGQVCTGSRHPGGRPDLRTPQGARLYDGLRRAATGAPEGAKREGALRSLAAMFGAESRPALLEVAADTNQATEIRDLAKRLAKRAQHESRSGHEIDLLRHRGQR
jgi:hypothetical protein